MDSRYLFRGKQIKTMKWVVGNYHLCDYSKLDKEKGHRVYSHTGHAISAQVNLYETPTVVSFEVDPATIGQCTGLKDKNGTLIFEGDICENQGDCILSGKYKGVILYGCTGGGYGFRWETSVSDSLLTDENIQFLEVIGNVHDNPDLLKLP